VDIRGWFPRVKFFVEDTPLLKQLRGTLQEAISARVQIKVITRLREAVLFTMPRQHRLQSCG
jgi:hypothetical protein